MNISLKSCSNNPTAVLFASEFPASEKIFAFALAKAAEFGADLIIFHVYDSLDIAASEASKTRRYQYAAARTEKQCFEPLAQRAGDLGIHCRVVVRPGLPADEILTFLRSQKIDCVIMGAHTPGPIGKLLVGSVAEAVLRSANVPVNIVDFLLVMFLHFFGALAAGFLRIKNLSVNTNDLPPADDGAGE